MVDKDQRAHRPPRRARRLPPAIERALRDAGEDVIAWRKLRGLTQAQLAERADVGVNTLRRLEHGDGGITLENLLRILRVLGVLDGLSRSLDPYESDVGRLRSDQQLPKRVRPRNLSGDGDG
ncbi:MAG TPA: helix-turn-helix transcriptional regulator [Candidatus Dormibacteraeota bacterium]